MDSDQFLMAANILLLFVCSLFVFFMQAGFAMFESGLVRAKNTVNALMKIYIHVAVASLVFWAVGYGFMFGENYGGWVGTNRFLFEGDSSYDFSFFMLQTLFAATAATIVSGAIAERIRYAAFVFISVIICALIYPVFGNWAWGSAAGSSVGWLQHMGFVDFAGSSVVHGVGGWCALAGVIALGPRLGRFSSTDADANPSHFVTGHNLPLVALGAFILWTGWFALNAGSGLSVTAPLGRVLTNTQLSGAAGAISMIVILLVMQRPIAFVHTLKGGLAGLVASGAGANVMGTEFAIITGTVAALFAHTAFELMNKLHLDDAVGAVGVHGVAGAWGTIAAGLFNPATFFSPHALYVQLFGVAVLFLWTFPTAFLMFKIVNNIVPLRIAQSDERRGLDVSEHDEISYPEFQAPQLYKGVN